MVKTISTDGGQSEEKIELTPLIFLLAATHLRQESHINWDKHFQKKESGEHKPFYGDGAADVTHILKNTPFGKQAIIGLAVREIEKRGATGDSDEIIGVGHPRFNEFVDDRSFELMQKFGGLKANREAEGGPEPGEIPNLKPPETE